MSRSNYKFGRKKRAYNSRIPHYSALLKMRRRTLVVAGYEDGLFKLISWGRLYQMTEEFFKHYVDECYAIADSAFIESTGLTPAGLSLEELEEQMQAMRMGPLEELARELRRSSP